MANLEEVKRYLKELPLELEVIEFEANTATSQRAAEVLGVEVGQIAKSILLMAKGEPCLVVTCGDARVNFKKVKQVLGKKARMAKPEEVKDTTGFEVGGVCPFALKQDIPIYIDASIKRFSVVYAAAGTDNTAVPITFGQLQELGGRPGDLCDIIKE